MRSAPRVRRFASDARQGRQPGDHRDARKRAAADAAWHAVPVQAIVEGMPSAKPVDALTTEEMRAFEASLTRRASITGTSARVPTSQRAAGRAGKPC